MNRADPSLEQQMLTLRQALEVAVQHQTAGDLSKAESIYRQILKADPNQPEALHLLGVITHQGGNNDTAVDLINKALVFKSDFPQAHNNLGQVLQKLGRLDEAVASYQNAINVKPDYVAAHFNLGLIFNKLGRLKDSISSYNKALAINPDYPEAHNNLGNALQELNWLDKAVGSYQKALCLKPDYTEAHYNLGIVLQDLGKLGEAFKCHQRAVTLEPQRDRFWAGLAASLESLSFTFVDDKLLQDLLHLLQRPLLRPSQVTRSIISALRHHPDFSQIFGLVSSIKLEIELFYPDIAERLSRIPLLLLIMRLSPLYDLEIEQMLTVLRHAMLEETIKGTAVEKVFPFSVALALHCFTNEYVFPETEEEILAVEFLQQQTATLLEKGKSVPPSSVVAIGAYRPLFDFPWAQELTEREWADNVKSIIEQQITEPQEERSLRNRIPCVTPIRNRISQSVREQFEENPWPLWIKTSIHYESGTIGNILRGPPFFFELGNHDSPEKPQILIAGCGTGRHAIYAASRFLNAHVLAVDLSLTSLAYAMRKTQELGFSNIQYVQGDITELRRLGRRFDLIECVGVLHHLDDPLTGWQILVDLLPSRGVLKIGLYSEIARQDIISWPSLADENSYTTSPEDIRQCRQDIIAMSKDGNRKMVEILNSRGFFSSSGCRDLLFPAREHRFTLPQIEETLRALKLKFLGFELWDKKALRKFRKSHPSKRALTTLSLWHEFELEHPKTFGGMYVFWCKKI